MGYDVNNMHSKKMMVDINSRYTIMSNSTLYDTLDDRIFHLSNKEMYYLKSIYSLDFKVDTSYEIDFFRQNRSNAFDVLQTNKPLYIDNTKIDGILGFSKSSIQKTNIYLKKVIKHLPHNLNGQTNLEKLNLKSFQDDLQENFDVSKKIFSIYLNPESSDRFSYMIIGEFEATIFRRRTLISFFSTRDYAWSFNIEFLQIGKTILNFPIKQDTFISLIHNYIGLSGKTFKMIKEILIKDFNVISAYENSEGFIEFQLKMTESQFQQNSYLRIYLIQRVYIKQCLLSVKDKIVSCQTKLKILDDEGLDDVIILGTPFLEYYYSVYNQENNKITIGMANLSDLEVAQAKFWYYIFVLLIFLFAILLICVGIFYKEEFQNLVSVVKNTIRYLCCRDQQSRLELLNFANS